MTAPRSSAAALPPDLMEGTNGTLMIVLAFMFIGALVSLYQTWRMMRHDHGIFRGIIETYHGRRATFALAVFLGSFGVRTGVIWWQRFAVNHGIEAPWNGWVTVVLLITSVTASVGGLYWLRETFPVVMGERTWLWLALWALAFGIASVLL